MHAHKYTHMHTHAHAHAHAHTHTHTHTHDQDTSKSCCPCLKSGLLDKPRKEADWSSTTHAFTGEGRGTR
jgi:hypothetical protein